MRRILSATLWLCAFTAISLSAETLQVIADNAPVMRGKDVVGKLTKGARINILVRKGNWLGVKVQTPGGEKQGWVNAKHLGPVVEAEPVVAVPVEVEPVEIKPVEPEQTQKPVQEPPQQTTPPKQVQRPQVKEILSTGLPAKSAEEALPGGAILHLKVHSGDKLIDAAEKLVRALLPGKFVPPPFQPILQQPRPLLAFVGAQMGGQPLDLEKASQMIGIDLARPLTLSVYPQRPDQWFVLSVPVSNRKAFSGLLMGMLRPRSMSLTEGQDQMYHIQPMKRDMPKNLFAVSSDDRVFISGSAQLAKMLYVTQAGASLANDPLITKTAQKYASRDISLVINPAFVKP
ncbi:MAG: hypothetical protein QF437_29295, partial [Planctomycetota bacterium]|nr:hypothetical protein [Planctomycetota bacterium]